MYTEMLVFLPEMCGLSRQVVSHGSGLPRQVSLYHDNVLIFGLIARQKIEVLEKQLESVEREKDILEERMERRHLQVWD